MEADPEKTFIDSSNFMYFKYQYGEIQRNYKDAKKKDFSYITQLLKTLSTLIKQLEKLKHVNDCTSLLDEVNEFKKEIKDILNTKIEECDF